MPGGGGGQTATTSQNSNSNFSQKTSPWDPFLDFLLGSKDADGKQTGETRGILPELNAAFKGSMWSPSMSHATNAYYNDVARRNDIFRGHGFENTGAAMNEGQFDPWFGRVGPIAPMEVTPEGARAAQGVLNPTSALYRFLNGTNTNEWIDQQGQAITGTLTRNMMENVMPGIRSGAIASGQYGGNRQGLAEATAISRLNQDIAPALTQLASGAWESAQNRGLTTGLALNEQAGNFAQAGANRDLQAKSINVATELQNNQQEMQRQAQRVSNRMNALGYTSGANAIGNQNYADLMKAIQAPGDQSWQNLARFASIFQPMMNSYTNTSGNSSNSSFGTSFQPTSSNPFGMALGGVMSLGSLAGNLFGAGGAFPGALAGIFR